MSLTCPNCGYKNENEERQRGYDVGKPTENDEYRDAAGWETELATPSVSSKRCPNCGERF